MTALGEAAASAPASAGVYFFFGPGRSAREALLILAVRDLRSTRRGSR